jgi:thymidylate synthase (FAD)
VTDEIIIRRSDITVELVDAMGSLERIVEAARVSTKGSGSAGSKADEGLVRYLAENRHASPFEHVVFTFRVEAPIFVTREMLRHRVSSFNEESGRYKVLDPIFYFPARDRKLQQVGKVGHYEFVDGTEEMHELVEKSFLRSYTVAWQEYQYMLSNNVAREVARDVLPLGIFSSLYYTANLRSLTNFLSLRTDWGEDAETRSHPTYEIELVSNAIGDHVKAELPFVWELFAKNGYRPL